MSDRAPGHPAGEVLDALQCSLIASVSVDVILQALRRGDLRGRNIHGRVGWRITRQSLFEWIDRGNVDDRDEASAV